MDIFFGWLIFSFVIGFIGSSRKIGFAGAFFASILLSPLIGLIITLVSKNKEEEKYKEQVLSVQKEQKETLKRLVKTKTTNENNSVVNELQKLKELKESQVINEDEFQKLKSRIIDNSDDDKSKAVSSKQNAKKGESKKINDRETLNKELALLRSKLQDNEVIIVTKESNEAQIISKEKYSKDKEMGISGNYNVVGRY